MSEVQISGESDVLQGNDVLRHDLPSKVAVQFQFLQYIINDLQGRIGRNRDDLETLVKQPTDQCGFFVVRKITRPFSMWFNTLSPEDQAKYIGKPENVLEDFLKHFHSKETSADYLQRLEKQFRVGLLRTQQQREMFQSGIMLIGEDIHDELATTMKIAIPEAS